MDVSDGLFAHRSVETRSGGYWKVKRVAALVGLEPPRVVTLTLTVRFACLGVFTVSLVAERYFTDRAATLPNRTVRPGTNREPMIVIVLPPLALPRLDESRLTCGRAR
jgi:hypothetical protein